MGAVFEVGDDVVDGASGGASLGFLQHPKFGSSMRADGGMVGRQLRQRHGRTPAPTGAWSRGRDNTMVAHFLHRDRECLLLQPRGSRGPRVQPSAGCSVGRIAEVDALDPLTPAPRPSGRILIGRAGSTTSGLRRQTASRVRQDRRLPAATSRWECLPPARVPTSRPSSHSASSFSAMVSGTPISSNPNRDSLSRLLWVQPQGQKRSTLGMAHAVTHQSGPFDELHEWLIPEGSRIPPCGTTDVGHMHLQMMNTVQRWGPHSLIMVPV